MNALGMGCLLESAKMHRTMPDSDITIVTPLKIIRHIVIMGLTKKDYVL